MAPLLLKAAEEGDRIAQVQVAQAASDLAEAILTADQMIGNRSVVIGGSVWKNDYYRALVQEKLGQDFRMIDIDLPPVYGAVLEAAAQAGIAISDDFRQNFRSTLQEG